MSRQDPGQLQEQDQADPARPRPTGGLGMTRFATRGEQRLSYESTGATDGIPVLVLHDLLADRGQFRPLAEALPHSTFRVTLPDARGHGASPLISGRAYPSRELAADALAVLDAEGLDAVHVVAIGWAAAGALRLAADAPERVASLTLVEPYLPDLLLDHPDPGAREAGAQHMDVIQRAADAAAKSLTDRSLDLLLGLRLGDAWRAGLPKARLGAIRRAAASLAPLLNATVSDRADPEAPRRLPGPVTVLMRADDAEFARWTAEALARLLPQSVMRQEAHPLAPEGRPAADLGWTPALVRILTAQGG